MVTVVARLAEALIAYSCSASNTDNNGDDCRKFGVKTLAAVVAVAVVAGIVACFLSFILSIIIVGVYVVSIIVMSSHHHIGSSHISSPLWPSIAALHSSHTLSRRSRPVLRLVTAGFLGMPLLLAPQLRTTCSSSPTLASTSSSLPKPRLQNPSFFHSCRLRTPQFSLSSSSSSSNNKTTTTTTAGVPSTSLSVFFCLKTITHNKQTSTLLRSPKTLLFREVPYLSPLPSPCPSLFTRWHLFFLCCSSRTCQKHGQNCAAAGEQSSYQQLAFSSSSFPSSSPASGTARGGFLPRFSGGVLLEARGKVAGSRYPPQNCLSIVPVSSSRTHSSSRSRSLSASSAAMSTTSAASPHPLLREAVPRTTACDPTHVPLVDCEKARKVIVHVQPQPPLASVKTEALVVGVPQLPCVANVEEDDALPPGSQTDARLLNGVCEAKKLAQLHSEVLAFDASTGDGLLNELLVQEEFKGKLASSCSGRLPSSNKNIRHAALLGFGDIKDLKAAQCAKIGIELAGLLRGNKAKTAALLLPAEVTPRQVQAILESLFLAASPDNRFKSLKSTACKAPVFEKLDLLLPSSAGAQLVQQMEAAVSASQKVAVGVSFAQQLVAAPANYVNTMTLAQEAVRMAGASGLEARVLDQAEIEKLNMGSYLAVAKGSMYPPKFIHLTYKPPSAQVTKRLAFVGKGLCFDAGGYNIKIDMGGAAAVLGAALAISQLKPPNVEVHFIIAAAENMVSEKAYRPGDVITASNGKTIEVGNTDAEGRLTLADALVYADKMGLDGIVDLATLTGACVVALGHKYAGVFSPNEAFVNKILESGATSGELLWQMPIVSEYRELIDSKIADMNNVGGGGKGGAITAAVFLKEFVSKTPWTHIDIAGPAWDAKDCRATGFGVRLLTELVMMFSTLSSTA